MRTLKTSFAVVGCFAALTASATYASDAPSNRPAYSLAYALKNGNMTEAENSRPEVLKKRALHVSDEGPTSVWTFAEFKADVAGCAVNSITDIERSDVDEGYLFEWLCSPSEGESGSYYRIEADVFAAANVLKVISTGRVLIPPPPQLKR